MKTKGEFGFRERKGQFLLWFYECSKPENIGKRMAPGVAKAGFNLLRRGRR